jgi:hypothetical protein
MGMAMEDPNVDVLSCPPSLKNLRYQRMKTYGNQFQMNDWNTKGMVNFDYGVASMFSEWQSHIGDEHASLQYVGVFKDILKLDYGPISTPIILIQCAWVWNGSDVRGNPTYKWDEVRFLLPNFWYMIAKDE